MSVEISDSDREPTLRARKACAHWLYICVKELGWKKEQLDELEACWWKYHDNNGHFKPSLVESSAPTQSLDLRLFRQPKEHTIV